MSMMVASFERKETERDNLTGKTESHLPNHFG